MCVVVVVVVACPVHRNNSETKRLVKPKCGRMVVRVTRDPDTQLAVIRSKVSRSPRRLMPERKLCHNVAAVIGKASFVYLAFTQLRLACTVQLLATIQRLQQTAASNSTLWTSQQHQHLLPQTSTHDELSVGNELTSLLSASADEVQTVLKHLGSVCQCANNNNIIIITIIVIILHGRCAAV